MYRATARQAASDGGAVVVAGDPEVAVGTFAVDSRKVEPGDAFVCFAGESVDGNDYALAALEAGAACVVMTRPPTAEEADSAQSRGACLLLAEDATGFLLTLAGTYRAAQDWLVAGVTGSVGKTTTKDMLTAVLGARYRVHSNRGNLNRI